MRAGKPDILPKGMPLGPLETQMMNLLWDLGSGTVREVLETNEVTGAYTTVMTTLDRLHKKGLLNREPEGRAYRYAPALTENEFNGAIVRNAVEQMLSAAKPSSAPISYLVEAISEHDESLLDELQRAIDCKRRELDCRE
jgi:BlaI family transcriptional regulator, penicillinase repressor